MSRKYGARPVSVEESIKAQEAFNGYVRNNGKGFVVSIESNYMAEPALFWLYRCPNCGEIFLEKGKGEPTTCRNCQQEKVSIRLYSVEEIYQFTGSGYMDPHQV